MRVKLDNPLLIAALGVLGFVIADYRKGPVPSGGGVVAKPAYTPPVGTWALLKRVGQQVSENQLMTQAAAITFYALLSIFPALAALVSLYGLIADPGTIVQQVDALGGVLPGGGQQLLTEQLKALTSASGGGLGWGFVIGLGTSIWTSNQAMKALFAALDVAHETKETRGFIKLTAVTLACTAGVIVFVVVALAAVVVVPAVFNFIGLGGVVGQLVAWLRWPFLLVCVAGLLAVLYRFGPCRDKVVWRWVTWGSGAAAVTWLIVSVLFSWYVANFGSYNKTYGSLGAVVGFMTWIWISSTVVLIGAQLDAELEKVTVGKQHPAGGGGGRAQPDADGRIR